MGKRSRAATAGLRPKRITSSQRRARKVNIEKARAVKNRKQKTAGSGLKAVMRHAKHNAPNLKWLKGNPKAKTVMIDEVKAFYR